MKLTFCGDLHGAFNALNSLYELEKPDAIIQCGDFGIWTDNNHKVRTSAPVPVYFCRGNHENHDLLDKLCEGNPVGVHFLKGVYFNRADNILLCNTGSNIKFNGTHSTLFIGGALSVDRSTRRLGVDYWSQELITVTQENLVLDELERLKPRIIVTHTAPTSIIEDMGLRDIEEDKYRDPTSRFLEYIFSVHKPEYWFFGHFHRGYNNIVDGTNFIGLNMCDHRKSTFDETFYYTLEI